MKHIMKPIATPLDNPLDIGTRIKRTCNSCPCQHCRSWRVRRNHIVEAERSRTYAFDLAALPNLDELLTQIMGGVDQISAG